MIRSDQFLRHERNTRADRDGSPREASQESQHMSARLHGPPLAPLLT